MAKRTLHLGDTSKIQYVFIRDSGSTTGAGKTGLVYNTSGLQAYYVRKAGSATSITLATQTVTGAWSSGGFVEIDATNLPGVYRFDIPDACLASGSPNVIVYFKGTGIEPCVCEFEMWAADVTDTQRLGLTALPAVDSGSAGAIITSGTGTAQLSVASGLVTPTTAANTAIAGAVWDEAASSHKASGSFGAMAQPLHSGTAQAATSTTFTLASGAVATNAYYANDLLQIVSGTGAGQSQYIASYVGSTKVATMNGTWATTPDNTSVYVIYPGGSIPGASAPTASTVADAVWNALASGYTTAGSMGLYLLASVSRQGTAQAGTTSSITLDSGASATNDLYKYQTVEIVSGTGAGQSSYISGYVGSTKVASVNPNFAVAPDSTSVFLIRKLGIDASTPTNVATAVWAATRAANQTAGSFGEYTPADAVRLSGDATAGTNAKNFFNGTGYAGTNNVIPSVTTVTGNVNGSVASVSGAVGSVTGNVGGNLVGSAASVTAGVTVTTNNDKTGYTLSNTGIDAVLDRAITEPSGVFAWAGASLRTIIAWLGALSTNKQTETSTTFTVRNRADSGTLATSAVSDDGTTATKASMT